MDHKLTKTSSSRRRFRLGGRHSIAIASASDAIKTLGSKPVPHRRLVKAKSARSLGRAKKELSQRKMMMPPAEEPIQEDVEQEEAVETINKSDDQQEKFNEWLNQRVEENHQQETNDWLAGFMHNGYKSSGETRQQEQSETTTTKELEQGKNSSEEQPRGEKDNEKSSELKLDFSMIEYSKHREDSAKDLQLMKTDNDHDPKKNQKSSNDDLEMGEAFVPDIDADLANLDKVAACSKKHKRRTSTHHRPRRHTPSRSRHSQMA